MERSNCPSVIAHLEVFIVLPAGDVLLTFLLSWFRCYIITAGVLGDTIEVYCRTVAREPCIMCDTHSVFLCFAV